MPLVTGHTVINGQPIINGKPATFDDKQSEFMAEIFSAWKCPECGAYLAKGSLICLNACHLSAASLRNFQNGLAHANRKAEGKG